MELTGKITTILPIQTGASKSGGEWKKQDIILQTEEAHPKTICITLWGNTIDDKLKQEDKIKASIDIESREFNGKWYTTVKAWKIEVLSASNEAQDIQAEDSINGEVDLDTLFSSGREEEMPF